ncbi:MAG TPA: hypothetical protein VF011_14235 [Terriglobales bacterium]
MTRASQIVITALMLTALYSALPGSNPTPQVRDHVIANSTADQVLMIADGTDPMPIKKR